MTAGTETIGLDIESKDRGAQDNLQRTRQGVRDLGRAVDKAKQSTTDFAKSSAGLLDVITNTKRVFSGNLESVAGLARGFGALSTSAGAAGVAVGAVGAAAAAGAVIIGGLAVATAASGVALFQFANKSKRRVRELDDSFKSMNEAINRLRFSILRDLAPTLIRLADIVTEVTKEFTKWFDSLEFPPDFVNTLINLFSEIVPLGIRVIGDLTAQFIGFFSPLINIAAGISVAAGGLAGLFELAGSEGAKNLRKLFVDIGMGLSSIATNSNQVREAANNAAGAIERAIQKAREFNMTSPENLGIVPAGLGPVRDLDPQRLAHERAVAEARIEKEKQEALEKLRKEAAKKAAELVKNNLQTIEDIRTGEIAKAKERFEALQEISEQAAQARADLEEMRVEKLEELVDRVVKARFGATMMILNNELEAIEKLDKEYDRQQKESERRAKEMAEQHAAAFLQIAEAGGRAFAALIKGGDSAQDGVKAFVNAVIGAMRQAISAYAAAAAAGAAVSQSPIPIAGPVLAAAAATAMLGLVQGLLSEFHEGGIVGPGGRRIPLPASARASGLAPDEAIARVQTGEVILPRGAMADMAGGGSLNVNLTASVLTSADVSRGQFERIMEGDWIPGIRRAVRRGFELQNPREIGRHRR